MDVQGVGGYTPVPPPEEPPPPPAAEVPASVEAPPEPPPPAPVPERVGQIVDLFA